MRRPSPFWYLGCWFGACSSFVVIVVVVVVVVVVALSFVVVLKTGSIAAWAVVDVVAAVDLLLLSS